MDTMGSGQQNEVDPFHSSGSGTISNANVSGVSVLLSDPASLLYPGSNPDINTVSPTDQGVVISYGPVTTLPNGSIEAASSYVVSNGAPVQRSPVHRRIHSRRMAPTEPISGF